MDNTFVLILFLIFGMLTCSMAIKCEDKPCLTCQECMTSQLYYAGGCSPGKEKRWPGDPTSLDVRIVYENTTDGHGIVEQQPYYHITLAPPNDGSIVDVTGFQVEAHHIQGGFEKFSCIVKHFTDCQLQSSQEIHLCFGPWWGGVFFSAQSLPAPPEHFPDNHISFYSPKKKHAVPDLHIEYGDRLVEDVEITVHNGTASNPGRVGMVFPPDGWRAYRLDLLSWPNHDIIQSKNIALSNEHQVFQYEFKDLCSGNYTIKIEAIDIEDECACYQHNAMPHLGCGFCTPAQTGPIAVYDYDTIPKERKIHIGANASSYILLLTVGFAIACLVSFLILFGFRKAFRSQSNTKNIENTLNVSFDTSSIAVSGISSTDNQQERFIQKAHTQSCCVSALETPILLVKTTEEASALLDSQSHLQAITIDTKSAASAILETQSRLDFPG